MSFLCLLLLNATVGSEGGRSTPRFRLVAKIFLNYANRLRISKLTLSKLNIKTMKKTLFVVTRAINEYNQDGDYFVAAFLEKPSFQDLKKILPTAIDSTIEKLLDGGGRQNHEQEWFFLREVKNGEFYIRS